MLDDGGVAFLDFGINATLPEGWRQLVKAIEQFGAKVPNELLLVSKQLLYLEGYTNALAPGHDLLGDTDQFGNFFGTRLSAGRVTSSAGAESSHWHHVVADLVA